MNKWSTLGVLAFASISAFAQKTVNTTFLWDGYVDVKGKVETGSPDSTAGYWYDYNDKNDGGSSAFTYPYEIEADNYGNFFGPLIEAYYGIKATVTLGPGYDYPYAGLGFNIWSEDQEGVDISAWQGICVSYESTIGFSIELGVENEKTVTAGCSYTAVVPKSPSGSSVGYPWEKFGDCSGWGGPDVGAPIDDVLAKTAAIKLKFEGTAGTSGNFWICQIGSLGQCSGNCALPCCGPTPPPDASIPAEAASSVTTRLVGRTLSFEGIALAKAEVIDLQGNVVKSATVSFTMDLSDLDAGMYMVRVVGKGVNIAQKIILK